MSTPYHVRLAISQYGDHFRTELFTEDLGDTEGDVIPELPSSISEWLPYLAQGAELPPDSARQLGKDLFSVLLGQPENAKKWSEVLSQAGRTKRSVRLLIDATGESVRDLPYGLLCEPHDDWYLFREGRELSVAFVRILRRCSPRPLRLPKRLRILLAVAEPRSSDVASFNAPKRLQQLAESLRAKADLFLCGPDGPVSYTELAEHFDLTDALTLTEFTRTTRESLRRSLQQSFDVFHMIAHGHGAGVLLCNARGEPAETTASELGSWCSQSKAALAFLQVCKASQTASRGGFGGVAQQLLNPRGGNLSAVVASTFPLDAEHSTGAAIAFYDRLSAGKPPEDALAFQSTETDWCWAFLELWARPGALSGTQSRSSFQFVSPYRGLSSFAEQDADLFFGRKAEVAELLRIIRSESAVAVVGDSGSGKSSLLQAGIASAVHHNGLGGIDKWRVVTLRPGYSPAQALFVALTGTNSELSAESSRSALTSDDQPLLLIMDQFEEIFTLARDKVEVQMLCNAILEAIERRGDKFRVIIGMRSEFLGQAASVPGLSRLIRRPWVLRPPGVSDLRAIVAGPAEHCGYTFQGPIEDGNPNHRIGLLDRILADPLLKSDSESATSAPLPLLQFALERLWLKAVEKGVTEFTHAEFDELGGMGMAIAQHAEAVFLASGNATGLKTEAHGLAEQIICSLVSTRMTRQPRLRESLQEESGNAEAARQIVDYLVGERLLTVRVDPEDLSSSMIDLSHEAIIENWTRLRDWLAEDRQGRALREEFRKAAEQWEFGFVGVPPRSWFALPAIDMARRYLVWIEDARPNLTATQSQFVDALRRMRTRVTRRRRIIMGSLSILTVASMLLGVIAWRKAGEATANGAAMTLAGGIRLCDEDRPRMGLLNIAKSLDRCPASASELRKDILYNLTVWTPKFMHLELACDLGGRAVAAARQGEVALIVDSKRRPHLVEVDAALKKEIRNGLGDLINPRLRDMILNNVDQHSSDKTAAWNELELDWREGMRARVVHVGNQWIVLTFDRKSLNQWNGFTGKQIGTTIHVNSDAEQGDRSHIAVADLSPDGKTVAVGLTDGNVQFWDAATGRKSSHELHHEGAINDLAFTNDSKMLAVACNRTIDSPIADDVKPEFFGNYSQATVKAKAAGCVRLWNLETGELDFWDWQSTPITYVSVSPNPAGTYLIYAGTHVESWNRVTRRPFDLSGATLGNRDWLLFQAALAGFDRVEDATEGLLNATTAETQDILRQFLAEHLANQEWTVAVGIRDNDGLLFSLDSSGTVRLWGLPVRSQKQQTEYAHRAGILSVAFGPESDSFATGCDNGCVYLWNTNDSERPYKRLVLQEVADGDPKTGISHIRYSRDGSRIIVQDDTLRTQVWNLETGQAVKLPAGETLITVASDGSTGLVATSKDEVIVKDLDTSAERCRIAVRGGARPFPDEAIDRRELMRVQRVAFSDDGKMLAMINADGYVEVFSTTDGKAMTKPLTHDASGSRHLIRALQFSPDGSRLLTQSRDVRAIWMTSSFQLENFYRDPTGVQMSRFSLDGRFVLTATNYNMARIWNVPKHRVDGDALLHGSRLWGVCSDQKGEFIATGSADRTARVWDAVTGLPVSPALIHDEAVSDVCFSRDGKLLLTGSWDGKARIWYAVTPVDDDVEQIKLSVETATGMHIGQSGATDLLSAAEWVERKKRISPKKTEAQTSTNK